MQTITGTASSKPGEPRQPGPGPCRPCANSAAVLFARPTWCTLCKKSENVFPLSRCIECDGAYLRVHDCRNRLGPNGRKNWDDMPLAKKNSFVKKAQELRGDRLRAEMITVVRQEVQRKSFGAAATEYVRRKAAKAKMETCHSGIDSEDSDTSNRKHEVPVPASGPGTADPGYLDPKQVKHFRSG